MLRASGLSVRLDGHPALQNASFEALEGQVCGLLGPNGSGKTTLFRALAGLVPTASGSAAWAGGPLDPRRHLFFLPDGVEPWPEQPAAWVLALVRGLFGGLTAAQVAWAERLGLEPFLHRPLGSLSKGQRKRVLLAAALSVPRPLVLLDEPFDGLDLRQARAAAALLREEAAKGRTLLVSLHQLPEAERTCDRLVLLEEGRVLAQGTMPELRAAAELPGATLEEVVLALG